MWRKKDICKALPNYSKGKWGKFLWVGLKHTWFFKETVAPRYLIAFVAGKVGPAYLITPSFMFDNSRFINQTYRKFWIRKDSSPLAHKINPSFMSIFLVSIAIGHYPISYFYSHFSLELLCFINHWLSDSGAKILKIFINELLVLGVELAVESGISVNGRLESKIKSKQDEGTCDYYQKFFSVWKHQFFDFAGCLLNNFFMFYTLWVHLKAIFRSQVIFFVVW